MPRANMKVWFVELGNRSSFFWGGTYFGEKTLQTNKWFLIRSNTIVYASRTMEFNPSGTRQGYPSVVFRRCPKSTSWELASVVASITETSINVLRRANIGEAYVIMNIKIPEITVEWLDMPWEAPE